MGSRPPSATRTCVVPGPLAIVTFVMAGTCSVTVTVLDAPSCMSVAGVNTFGTP